ncbi:hypothetical protein FA95DRAFT_1539594 [Auriscalpium vulgare]|uniref:Uncharacterized protein n=1 Tax=Auriscalpium vulgare TaxID=40419 RepID=A0ACB8RX59_9AGAM|nr:hypothetical protein FA95DRAFT_1539594 [Auriscalpium vulgare]
MLVTAEPAVGTFGSTPKSHEMAHRIGWIKVTHVCRRWREIALGCSSLWTYIAFPLGDQWATEMATRAGSAPLEIAPPTDYRSPEDRLTPSQLALINDHFLHIGEMAIVVGNDSADELIEHMTVSMPQHLQLTRWAMQSRGMRLPDFLLGGDAPKLRPWSSGILSGLASLSVNMTIYNSDNLTDMYCETMLDASERMPGLELLRLKTCFPPHSHATGSQRRVQLPRLKYFDINSLYTSDCLHVITHLDTPLPPTIRLSMHERGELEPEGGFTPILPIIASSLAPHGCDPSNAAIKRLHINNADHTLSLDTCQHHVCPARSDLFDFLDTLPDRFDCPQFTLHAFFSVSHGPGVDDGPGVWPIRNLVGDIWAHVPWPCVESERLKVELGIIDQCRVGGSPGGSAPGDHGPARPIRRVILRLHRGARQRAGTLAGSAGAQAAWHQIQPW